MSENSYIVRIYRRSDPAGYKDPDGTDAVNVTGKINDVRNDKWKTFHNKDELWGLITEQESVTEEA